MQRSFTYVVSYEHYARSTCSLPIAARIASTTKILLQLLVQCADRSCMREEAIQLLYAQLNVNTSSIILAQHWKTGHIFTVATERENKNGERERERESSKFVKTSKNSLLLFYVSYCFCEYFVEPPQNRLPVKQLCGGFVKKTFLAYKGT